MFRLYWLYELTLQLGLKYFQYILTPVGLFREVYIHYDLSYEENGFSLIFVVSKKKYSLFPLERLYKRKWCSYSEPIYDKVDHCCKLAGLWGQSIKDNEKPSCIAHKFRICCSVTEFGIQCQVFQKLSAKVVNEIYPILGGTYWTIQSIVPAKHIRTFILIITNYAMIML